MQAHERPLERGKPSEEEAPHDILAAEAFAVPAPDPTLHHDPLVLPEDPSGIAEPHDILAAEEFAMPAGEPQGARAALAHGARSRRNVALAGMGALLALVGLRRRRR